MRNNLWATYAYVDDIACKTYEEYNKGFSKVLEIPQLHNLTSDKKGSPISVFYQLSRLRHILCGYSNSMRIDYAHLKKNYLSLKIKLPYTKLLVSFRITSKGYPIYSDKIKSLNMAVSFLFKSRVYGIWPAIRPATIFSRKITST